MTLGGVLAAPPAGARALVFSWTWFWRRGLFFWPAAAVTGAAFGSWHGTSMGTPDEGVDLAVRAALACLLAVTLGPLLAVLVRRRGLSRPLERVGVVVALAAGLLAGLEALRMAMAYHDGLMRTHGVTQMAHSPQAQALTRVFYAFFDQGPRWVVLFVGAGGGALIAYFREERERAWVDLQVEKDVVDTRLAVLQAQVEPHFLFNTLASVRSLVRTDPDRAALTIDALADYLRTTLPKFREESGMLSSTLGDQIDRCTSYLTLMNVRMDGRMRVEVDVQPGLRALPFPPLVLISLVENAVRHGLEPKAGRGAIRIAAERRGGELEVSVADDGAGLSEEAVDAGGVGLANVRSQLQNRFGAAGRLEVTGQPQGGVRAVILTPVRP